ncbi:MAG: RAQPRD family integrative conjugative element protein [Woeseia sp.]
MNRSQTIRTLLLIGVSLIALQGAGVLADADAERDALVRLVHALELVEPLIVEASRAADPDARIRFQYNWLRHDLETVRRGIDAHIDASAAEPYPVEPLRGDYRR